MQPDPINCIIMVGYIIATVGFISSYLASFHFSNQKINMCWSIPWVLIGLVLFFCAMAVLMTYDEIDTTTLFGRFWINIYQLSYSYNNITAVVYITYYYPKMRYQSIYTFSIIVIIAGSGVMWNILLYILTKEEDNKLILALCYILYFFPLIIGVISFAVNHCVIKYKSRPKNNMEGASISIKAEMV